MIGHHRRRPPRSSPAASSRFGDDGHTLERLPSATGGYAGAAQGARPWRPPQVGDEVKDRQPARPRRRRLPRRREVGLLPARRVAPLPRGQRRRVRAGHLQGPPPHGARSPPAHRGRACIACYAIGAARPSSTSAARWPWPRSASPQALNEAYAAGYVGKNILGTDFSRRHRPALGCRRLHRGRGDRAHRVASRATGACPASSRRSSRRPRASTCSPRSSTTSRRCRTCRGSSTNGGEAYRRARAPRRRRGTRHVRGVGPRQATRASSRSSPGVTTFRDLIYDAGSTAAASATATSSRCSSPAAPRPRGSSPSTSTCPLERARRRRCRLDARLGRHRRDGRDHRRGARPCLRARALLRPRVLRQVHAVP